MEYWVVFEPNSGSLVGISTYEDLNVPQDFVREQRTGNLPKDISSWNTATRQFEDVIAPVTKLEFLTRFTPTERVNIRSSQATDLIIDDFMKMLEISQEVDLRNPMVEQGLNYLVYKNLLTSDRVSKILGV